MSYKRDRLLTVFSCFIFEFIIAVHLIWSTISVYIYSYFHNECDSTISIQTMNIINPIGSIFGLLMIPFSLKVGRMIGFRKCFLIAGILIGIIFMITTIFQSFILFLLVFGVILFCLHGIMAILPLYCATKLYYEKKGLISGLVHFAMGISESLIGYLYSELMNPNNIKTVSVDGKKLFPQSVTDNYYRTHLIIGSILIFLSLVSFFLFRVKGLERTVKSNSIIQNETEKDEFLIESQLDSHQSNQSEVSDLDSDNSYISLNSRISRKETAVIIKDPKFYKYPSTYILPLMIFTSTTFSVGLNINYKSIGLQHINSDKFVTDAGTIALLISAVSRIGLGKLIDHVRFEVIYFPLLTIQLILCITFRWMVEEKILFFLMLVLNGICLSGNVSLFNIYAIKIFGLENGNKIYAFILIGYGFSSFNQFFFYEFLLPHVGYNKMNLYFSLYVLACFGLTILNSYLLYKHKKKKRILDFSVLGNKE